MRGGGGGIHWVGRERRATDQPQAGWITMMQALKDANVSAVGGGTHWAGCLCEQRRRGAEEGHGGPGGSRSETRWCRHSSQYIYRSTDLTLSPHPPLQVKLVSCSELTLAQSSRSGVIVVDIRPEGEYEKVWGRGRSPDVRWGA